MLSHLQTRIQASISFTMFPENATLLPCVDDRNWFVKQAHRNSFLVVRIYAANPSFFD